MKYSFLMLAVLLQLSICKGQVASDNAYYSVIFGSNSSAKPLRLFFNEYLDESIIFSARDHQGINDSLSIHFLSGAGDYLGDKLVNPARINGISFDNFGNWIDGAAISPFNVYLFSASKQNKDYVFSESYQNDIILFQSALNIFKRDSRILVFGNEFSSTNLRIFDATVPDYLSNYFYGSIIVSDFYDVIELKNQEILLLIGDSFSANPSIKIIRFDRELKIVNELEIPGFEPANKMSIIPFEDESTFLVFSEKPINGHYGIALNENFETQWFLDFDDDRNVLQKESFVQGPANTLYFVRSGQANPSVPFKTYLHRILDNGVTVFEKEVKTDFSNGYPWRVIRDWKDNIVGAGITNFGQVPAFLKDPVLLRWDTDGNLLNSWNYQEEGDFELEDFIVSPSCDYILLGSHEIPGQPVKNQVINIPEGYLKNEKPVTFQVFEDKNRNCTFDSLDTPFQQGMIKIVDQVEKYRLGDYNGRVLYQPENEIISLEVIPPNSSWESCLSQPLQINLGTEEELFVPLLLTPAEFCPVLDIFVSVDSISPCNNSTYSIQIQNKGTIKAEGVTLTFIHDEALQLAYASNIIFQDGNVVKLSIPDLSPGKSHFEKLLFNTDCDLGLEEKICVEFQVEAENDCTGGEQRQFAYKNKCQDGRILGNPQKFGFENGNATNRFVRKDSFVDYELFIKNNDFTTLYGLIISDEIEENLDITSLRVRLNFDTKIIDQRTLQFSFPWLYLQPGEAIKIPYSIKPKSTLQNGDTFSNQATFITYNDEKRTNKLTLQIGERSSTSNPDLDFNLTLYPNPTQGTFHLETDIPTENLSLEIVHVSGQVFYQGPFKKMIDQNTLALPAGSYIITCLKDGKPILSKQLLVF